jgi:hypothetical protein
MFSVAGAAGRDCADRPRTLQINLDGEFPLVKWELLTDPGALAQWDHQLLALDDYSIYQSIAWGEHRRALGWTPYRWAAVEDGAIVAMAQGLVRRYPGGIGVVWLPGGPVGNIQAWSVGLQQVIRRTTRLTILYCRFNSFRARGEENQQVLANNNWQQPRTRLTTGASLHYNLARPEPARLASCSKNWRHNLKRSHKSGFAVTQWAKPDVAELRSVYAEMEDYKHLSEQHSEQNLRALYDHVGDRLITFSCRDAGGVLIAFRACVTFGDKAWDILAATAVAGRKAYASYATFWALMQECHRRGVTHYDLSGVDPVGNRGVYDFKQGTGATPVEYLGEWEWASPLLFALPANWLIGTRRNGI